MTLPTPGTHQTHGATATIEEASPDATLEETSSSFLEEIHELKH